MAQQQITDPNWGIADPNWGQPVPPAPTAPMAQPNPSNVSPAVPSAGARDLRRSVAFAPDAIEPAKPMERVDPKAWLRHYPGLGNNGAPNEWGRLLSQTVDEGIKTGRLNRHNLAQLLEGRFPADELGKILTRARRGSVNPWVEDEPTGDALAAATAQSNPLVWLLYGANAALGTNVANIGPRGINPMGQLGSEADESTAETLRPAAMLAQTLPFGILGRVTGAVVGGATDAGAEAMRQEATGGAIDPWTVGAQGAIGAAANFLPGLGRLGTGGRIARGAKGAGLMATYAGASNATSMAADRRLGVDYGPEGSPYDLTTGMGPATALGAVMSSFGKGKRTQGGKWNDKGLIGQFRDTMDAQRAQQAASAVAQATPPPAGGRGAPMWIPPAPSHTPAGQPPGQPGTDPGAQLKAVNARLRQLTREKGYGTPEYEALVQQQRTLQSAFDQSQPSPTTADPAMLQSKLKSAQQELDALEAAKVQTPRIDQLKRNIKALNRQLAGARPAGTPSPLEPVKVAELGIGTVPIQPAPTAGATRPASATANLPLTGSVGERTAAMLSEDPAIAAKAKATQEAAQAAKTGEPGKLTIPTAPAPAVQPSRIATPHVDLETYQRHDPAGYETTKRYAADLIHRLGYARGREHIEAIIQNRESTVDLKAIKGKNAGRVVKTTGVLSKNPHNLGLVWQELAPTYEAKAKAAGQSRPVEQLRALTVPTVIDEPFKQTLRYRAQQIGREDVIQRINAPEFDSTQAAAVLKDLQDTAAKTKTAGYVPPKHTGNPLSIWSLGDIERAAKAMFSSKKKPVDQPTHNQVLAAGSRLMERYERLLADGKVSKETAAQLLEMAVSGRIKENRLNAKGYAMVGLQDWSGQPAGKPPAATLGDLLPDLTSGHDTQELGGQPIRGATSETDVLTTGEVQSLENPKLPKGAVPTKPSTKGLPKDFKPTGTVDEQRRMATARISERIAQIRSTGFGTEEAFANDPQIKALTAFRDSLTSPAAAPAPAKTCLAGRELTFPTGRKGVVESASPAKITVKMADGVLVDYTPQELQDALALRPAKGAKAAKGPKEPTKAEMLKALELGPNTTPDDLHKAAQALLNKEGGATLGDKFLAAAPFAYPTDDKDDDTSTMTKRLLSMGLAAVGGIGLFKRARSAWRLKGKPVGKLEFPEQLGKRLALVHDDVDEVVRIGKQIKAAHPDVADQVEGRTIKLSDGRMVPGLYVPASLENNPTFVKRFSKTLEQLEGHGKKTAPAAPATAVQKATTIDELFGPEGPGMAAFEQMGDVDGPQGEVDFESFEKAAAGLTQQDLAGGAQPGRTPKPDVPMFAAGEDIKPLVRVGPATRRKGDEQWLYDPREAGPEGREALRDPRHQKESYYQQLEESMAKEGYAISPRQGEIKVYPTWDPRDPNDPLNAKLAELQATAPFSRPAVRQNDKGGFYISVDTYGYYGPRVIYKNRAGQEVQAHQPGGWKGWHPDYLEAVKKGEANDPTAKFVGRYGGKIVAPGEAGAIAMRQIEDRQGRPIDMLGKRIGVSDEPVPISTAPEGQQAKIKQAITAAFPTAKFVDSNTGLKLDRRFFDGLSPGEREYIVGLTQADDPLTFNYGGVDEPMDLPVGAVVNKGPKTVVEPLGPEGQQRVLEARETTASSVVPAPHGESNPLVQRVAQIKQIAKRMQALLKAEAVEPDPAKREILRQQYKANERMQNRLFQRQPKDVAKTGKRTLKQAIQEWGKDAVVERGDEMRMAEIRTVLKETFGDQYTDHFAVGYRKGQGGGQYLMALSPEFMASANREQIAKGKLMQRRIKLRTGEAPPFKPPAERIVNERVDVPIKSGQIVEYSTRTGAIERGTVLNEVGGNVLVKTKGGQMPIGKAHVRVVEEGGARVSKPTLRDTYRNRDLINDLAADLHGKTAETLTNEDLDKVWTIAIDESRMRRKPVLEVVRQMYKDQGLPIPDSLKAGLKQPVDPFEVIRDVLWNAKPASATGPTAGEQLAYGRLLDQEIDKLIKAGAIDPTQRSAARLTLLKRMVGMGNLEADAPRVEQLQQHLERLEEAVGGLPRDPFGGSADPADGIVDPVARLKVLSMRALAASGGDYVAPSGPVDRGMYPARRLMPAIRQAQTELPSSTKDLAYGQTMGMTKPRREAPPKMPLEKPPLPEPTKVSVGSPEELNKLLGKGEVDAVLVFDQAFATRPKATKGSTWVPLPTGTRLYAKRDRYGAPGSRPAKFGPFWKVAGHHWQTTKRLLNPTASEISTLLSERATQAGKFGQRRSPTIVVIGDDGGRVDFAVSSRRPGAFDFRQALRDLARTLGKTTAELTKADLKADWRLMAAAPAGALDYDDEDDPARIVKGLLPMALIAGGVGLGALALRRYRMRPIRSKPLTGPTALDALLKRQTDVIAEGLRKPPPELGPTSWRKRLQNSYIQLEKEQGRYDTQQLLPDERAWDVWSTSLGGGGGRTDAAMRRMRETVSEARTANLDDALFHEWNIRSSERIIGHFYDKESQAQAAIAQLTQARRALRAQMTQATSATQRLAIGRQIGALNRQLKPERRKFGVATRGIVRLHQGTMLPGGLTPTSLAAERTAIRQRLSAADQLKVQQWANRLYQEHRFILDDLLSEGIISQTTWNRVVQADRGYVNVRKAVTQILMSRKARMQGVWDDPTISVAVDKIVKHLKDPGGLDPVHPLKASMLTIREANQELAMQQASRSMVRLLQLDPAHQVRVVRPGRSVDQAWMRQHDMGMVSFMDQGRAIHYAVPRAFAEMALAAGTTPAKAEGLAKFVQMVSNGARAGMTWANPVFLGKNVVRDVGGARQFLPEAFGRGNPLDYARTWSEWAGSLMEVLHNSPEYQQMLESGASYSTYTKGQDPNTYLDMLEEDILGQRGPKILIRSLREGANALEEATKLMVYKRLGQRGIQGLDQSTLTRRFGGSPDFWVHGDWSRALGNLMLFFNPAVQGVDQSVKGATRTGQGRRLPNIVPMVAGTVVAATVRDQWNNQFVAEEGDAEIDHVDPTIKANNFVFLLPFKTQTDDGLTRNRYLAIPKPHISQLLHTPVEALLDYRRTGDVNKLREGLSSMASKLSPFSSGVDLERPSSIIEAPAASLTPALRVPIELARDRQFYGDRPIEGEGFKDIERFRRIRPSTPTLFRDLGAAARPLTSDKQGLSPAALRYAVRSFAPGPVDVATDVYEQASQALGRPGATNARIPVLSQFKNAVTGPTMSDAKMDQQRTRFYAELAKARTTEGTRKFLMKQGKVDEAKALPPSRASQLEAASLDLAELRKETARLQAQARTATGPAKALLMKQLKDRTDTERLILTRSLQR